MFLRRRFSPALLFGAACLAVMTHGAYAETLQDAVQATLLNHPSMETAKTGSTLAAQQKREEYSGYFPKLNVTGQTGRIYGDNSTSRGLTVTRGAAYSNFWEGSATARETLFNGFQTGNRVDSAQAKLESANMNVMDVSERLAYSTAQAYIDILRSREGMSMLEEQQKKIADYQQRIKKMVDDGASNEAEYQQARDIGVLIENMIADYSGQIHTAEAYYTEMTGHIPAEAMDMPPVPGDSLIPGSAEDAINYAKANHPALKAASLLSKSATYDAQAEQGSLYPEIDGELSYLQNDKKEVLGGQLTDSRAVVRMNWDFDTGGAELARIEQKKLQQREAASQAEEMERQLERTIRLSYSDYQKAKQQADGQQKRVELNETLFKTYGIQFEGSRVTLLQLMQSDNQLFTTKLERMNGTYKLLAARYAILAGMGRLQEALSTGATRVSSVSPQIETRAAASPAAVEPVMTAPLPSKSAPGKRKNGKK